MNVQNYLGFPSNFEHSCTKIQQKDCILCQRRENYSIAFTHFFLLRKRSEIFNLWKTRCNSLHSDHVSERCCYNKLWHFGHCSLELSSSSFVVCIWEVGIYPKKAGTTRKKLFQYLHATLCNLKVKAVRVIAMVTLHWFVSGVIQLQS